MANSSKKQRSIRFVLIVNAFTLFMGGLHFVGDGKIGFGSLQFITAALNVALLFTNTPARTSYCLYLLLFALNILIAISIAYDYIQQGSKYIQYMWMLTAGITLGASIVFARKNKTTLQTNTN